MKFTWFAIALAALSVATAGSASARAKHRPPHQTQCIDQPRQFSWGFLLPGQSVPHPNGCSPAVYTNGQLVGQDPDPNIRFQLLRDPATGYSAVAN